LSRTKQSIHPLEWPCQYEKCKNIISDSQSYNYRRRKYCNGCKTFRIKEIRRSQYLRNKNRLPAFLHRRLPAVDRKLERLKIKAYNYMQRRNASIYSFQQNDMNWQRSKSELEKTQAERQQIIFKIKNFKSTNIKQIKVVARY